MTEPFAPPRVHSPRTGEVVTWAERFALGHAANPLQRSLLARAFGGLRSQIGMDHPLCIPVPLSVYEAICGTDSPAVPLAAAATMLYLGVDIFDDLADRDLPGHWQGCHPGEVSLAAATLFSALPQLVIAELDAPCERIAAMQQIVAAGLLQMAAGQQMDIALCGAGEASTEQVEKSVEGKSGAEIAMFARLAAVFAGCGPELVESCGAFGIALGTAGQLASDCHDLFQAAESHDLANGTRTWPIASHLGRLQGEDRQRFLALLDRARLDSAARDAVRYQLRAAGELRRCAFVVEIYIQRARREFRAVRPVEPETSGLEICLKAISFFAGNPSNQSFAPEAAGDSIER